MCLIRPGIALTLHLSIVLAVGQADEQDRKADIIAAWTSRTERQQSGRFEWSTTQTRSIGIGESNRQITTISNVRFVVGPGMQRRYERSGEQELGVINQVARIGTLDRHVVYDGTECRTFISEEDASTAFPCGFIGDENELEFNQNLNPVLWSIGRKPFVRGMESIAEFELIHPSLELNGTPFAVLKYSPPQSKTAQTTTIWLNAKLEYALARVEIGPSDRNQISVRYDIESIRNRAGEIVPSVWTISTFRGDGQPDKQWQSVLGKSETEPMFRPEDFRIDFPPGTYVNDHRGGKNEWFIQRANGERRLVLETERFVGYQRLLETETGEAIVPRSK